MSLSMLSDDRKRILNVKQQFGKMAGSVLNLTFGILINISA